MLLLRSSGIRAVTMKTTELDSKDPPRPNSGHPGTHPQTRTVDRIPCSDSIWNS